MGSSEHQHLGNPAELVAVWNKYLRPQPVRTLVEWAEANRVLSSKDSAEAGPYRVSRTPYAIEPMNCLSAHSPVEEVVLMWGAQTAKTTIGMNWVGYVADVNQGSMMIVQPTLDMAKRFSRQRLSPMIQESEQLRAKITKSVSRDEANTILLKEFPGGFMAVAGANSAAGLRSMPVRDLFLDEVDGYPQDVDGEGEPCQLAEARQSTFANCKRLRTSTPTIKGLSRIERAFADSDRCYYHVPCPHCGHYQPLVWGGTDLANGIKWRKDADGKPDPASAHYVCRDCGAEIYEHAKLGMLAAGRWVASQPGVRGGRVRGFHLSSLYSPLGWLSWADLVREWLQAVDEKRQGNAALWRVFVNTRLAETYEAAQDCASEHDLMARPHAHQLGVVPLGCLVLCAGVDVQDNRLELAVWGFGVGEEMWLIEHRVIEGDPAADDTWLRLDDALAHRYPLDGRDGKTLGIEASAIDIGGHFTHAVYAYARTRAHRRIVAVQGSRFDGRPIKGKSKPQDVNWRGKVIKGGVKLWEVGTDTAKDLLFARLHVKTPGPGYIHFPDGLPLEFYQQLTAEVRVLQKTATGQTYRWVKRRPRNEALDCTVYAIFCSQLLDLHRYSPRSWQRLREAIWPEPQAQQPLWGGPAEADPPELPESPAAEPVTTTNKPRRRGRIGTMGGRWPS